MLSYPGYMLATIPYLTEEYEAWILLHSRYRVSVGSKCLAEETRLNHSPSTRLLCAAGASSDPKKGSSFP